MLNRHERRQSEPLGISRKSAKRRTEENQSQSERSCIGMKEGNLSPSVLAKTQVLCFSLSIRYVARLARACPIYRPTLYQSTFS